MKILINDKKEIIKSCIINCDSVFIACLIFILMKVEI